MLHHTLTCPERRHGACEQPFLPQSVTSARAVDRRRVSEHYCDAAKMHTKVNDEEILDTAMSVFCDAKVVWLDITMSNAETVQLTKLCQHQAADLVPLVDAQQAPLHLLPFNVRNVHRARCSQHVVQAPARTMLILSFVDLLVGAAVILCTCHGYMDQAMPV